MTPERDILAERALAVRRDVVRMIGVARSGHLASSLSIVDLLVWLYWEVLSLRADEPSWEGRDRFVLGKGHGCPALYAVLANKSFFPREELWSYRRLGAMLQGFPEIRRTPGVDAPGGSLGQGLGLANGLALALRDRTPAPSVYCLVGDGELQEGVFWESAMTSAHFSLDNLLLLVDRNGRQMEGATEDIMSLEPLREKFLAFGWAVEECDGHDFASMRNVLGRLGSRRGKPGCIVAKTTLGKGVSFLENDPSGGRMVLGRESMDKALRELEKGGD
ncbi:transketolase [Aminivibrio sp.]|jgi:transketolase|uniref:transketolase n=1 Tax=Aminivibrio sp. TaxID=1872489 RepID=UPI001A5EDBBD|nr:transketolase [Aminivibrio sp.]MBL3540171.1 transketolase [Aminivibrio sp.]MDK2959691.1 transketolase [Synergistaceae bacterium]